MYIDMYLFNRNSSASCTRIAKNHFAISVNFVYVMQAVRNANPGHLVSLLSHEITHLKDNYLNKEEGLDSETIQEINEKYKLLTSLGVKGRKLINGIWLLIGKKFSKFIVGNAVKQLIYGAESDPTKATILHTNMVSELQAFANQIFAQMVFAGFKGTDLNRYLDSSNKWVDIQPYITNENKNRLLKYIYACVQSRFPNAIQTTSST